MSKNHKFEFKINSSPHLTMGEITKQLFNQNFHSDVQFCVDGKIIYAHSLELMKRSVVFERQLGGTMGEIKFIPINDCKYETFLEFIRFIYTDECEINHNNGIELLKLATTYKVIVLENRVLRIDNSIKWILKCFEHCIRDKYALAHNAFNARLQVNFKLCAEHEQFLSLHPDAMDELLKFERVRKGVTERQIFTALANWIASYCKKNQIPLSEGRQRFDKQIKKIRFPTMPIEDIRECAKNYPGLLSDSDCVSIWKQTIFGDRGSETDLWISKRREEFNSPILWRSFDPAAKFKTSFSVSKDAILYGLLIGTEEQNKLIRIEIVETDVMTGACQKLMFIQNAYNQWGRLIIGLGDSIRLTKFFQYTIVIEYLEVMDGNIDVVCRTENANVIINDPDQAVHISQASANMLEMFFKRPTELQI